MTLSANNNRQIDIRRFIGADVRGHLDAVAALRITVFRDWPYLYDGDAAYEREYLQAYASSADSVFVLAFDGDAVIGASTGLPLADDSAEFRAPFDVRGIDTASVFYFGESILLPAYRGQGIGHAFFDHREAHARERSRFDITAFCAVDRDVGDPRRPQEYRGNEIFWSKRGYKQCPEMIVRLRWKEPDRGELEHRLTFWTRPLGGESVG